FGQPGSIPALVLPSAGIALDAERVLQLNNSIGTESFNTKAVWVTVEFRWTGKDVLRKIGNAVASLGNNFLSLRSRSGTLSVDWRLDSRRQVVINVIRVKGERQLRQLKLSNRRGLQPLTFPTKLGSSEAKQQFHAEFLTRKVELNIPKMSTQRLIRLLFSVDHTGKTVHTEESRRSILAGIVDTRIPIEMVSNYRQDILPTFTEKHFRRFKVCLDVADSRKHAERVVLKDIRLFRNLKQKNYVYSYYLMFLIGRCEMWPLMDAKLDVCSYTYFVLEHHVILCVAQGVSSSASRCNDEQKTLLDPGRLPSVFVCIREDPFSKENIYLKMQGFNLDKKDFFGKSDPYVTIYRRNERGKEIQSEYLLYIHTSIFRYPPNPTMMVRIIGRSPSIFHQRDNQNRNTGNALRTDEISQTPLAFICILIEKLMVSYHMTLWLDDENVFILFGVERSISEFKHLIFNITKRYRDTQAIISLDPEQCGQKCGSRSPEIRRNRAEKRSRCARNWCRNVSYTWTLLRRPDFYDTSDVSGAKQLSKGLEGHHSIKLHGKGSVQFSEIAGDLIGEFTTTISELLRSDENGLEFKRVYRSSYKRYLWQDNWYYPLDLTRALRAFHLHFTAWKKLKASSLDWIPIDSRPCAFYLATSVKDSDKREFDRCLFVVSPYTPMLYIFAAIKRKIYDALNALLLSKKAANDQLVCGTGNCKLFYGAFHYRYATSYLQLIRSAGKESYVPASPFVYRVGYEAFQRFIFYETAVRCSKIKRLYLFVSVHGHPKGVYSEACFGYVLVVPLKTSINVVIGVDLSNHISSKQMPASRQIEVAQSCNEYSVAIQAVMEILQEYDRIYPFQRITWESPVSIDDNTNRTARLLTRNQVVVQIVQYQSGDENNYFCKGMAGVLEAYRRSFEALHLSGPICFSPIIRDVSDTARRNKDTENYYVLLILTNGTVDDWIETKKAVIEVSRLFLVTWDCMSHKSTVNAHLCEHLIFIVDLQLEQNTRIFTPPIMVRRMRAYDRKNVTLGDSEDMEILDQDFGLLKVGQEQACRDNVQFVQMRRFLRLAADGSDNLRWSKVGLAKEVLAELPSQILDYFERNHLLPCHSIPGQPKLLKDLVDPAWWRAFTQPDTSQVSEEFSTTVQTAQSSTEITSSSNNKGRMQLPTFHTNASEHSNVAVRTCSVPTKHDQSVVQEFKTLHIDRSWDGKIPARTPVSRDPNSTFDYGQSEDPGDHFGATRSGVSSLQVRRQMSLGPSMHGASPIARVRLVFDKLEKHVTSLWVGLNVALIVQTTELEMPGWLRHKSSDRKRSRQGSGPEKPPFDWTPKQSLRLAAADDDVCSPKTDQAAWIQGQKRSLTTTMLFVIFVLACSQ
ncbi:copine-8, partial [Clonorchis sinensis]